MTSSAAFSACPLPYFTTHPPNLKPTNPPTHQKPLINQPTNQPPNQPTTNQPPQVDTTPPVVRITRKPEPKCANASVPATCAREVVQSDPRVTITFGDDGPDRDGDVRAYACRWLGPAPAPPSPDTPDDPSLPYGKPYGACSGSSTYDNMTEGYWLFQVKVCGGISVWGGESVWGGKVWGGDVCVGSVWEVWRACANSGGGRVWRWEIRACGAWKSGG